MKSEAFGKFKMPVADYQIEPGVDELKVPTLFFRAPGQPLRRFYLSSARQMQHGMERAGERDNAAEMARLIDQAEHLA